MAGAAAGAAAGGIIGGAFQLGATALEAKAQEKAQKRAIRAQERIHESQAAEREKLSQMTRADQERGSRNLLAAESARLSVLSSLGQPGTYGPSPGARTGPISLGVLKPTGLAALDLTGGGAPGSTGLLGSGRTEDSIRVTGEDVRLRKKPRFKGSMEGISSGYELDAGALARGAMDTAGFRTVSAMVAEAEQLMNREGPLWDQLNNSVVGNIYQSNAAFQRQAMEQIARSLAQGGTARRVGLQMAQAFQAQEQINRNRTGQLWQAKMQLEQFRTQYAKEVTSYSQAWVSNQAGIRDAFTASLQNLQMYWASTMAPALAGASVQAQAATQEGVGNAAQGMHDAIATAGQSARQAIEGITNTVNSYLKTKYGSEAAAG